MLRAFSVPRTSFSNSVSDKLGVSPSGDSRNTPLYCPLSSTLKNPKGFRVTVNTWEVSL